MKELGVRSVRVVRVRRRRRLNAVVTFLLPLLVLLGIPVVKALGDAEGAKVFAGLSIMATWVLLPLFGALARPAAKTRRASVSIGADGLELRDEATRERLFAGSEIASGNVHTPGRTPVVELHEKDGDIIEIDAASYDEAHQILDRAGLDADSRRATFSVPHRNRLAMLVGVVVSLLVAIVGFKVAPPKTAWAALALLSPGVIGYWVSRLIPPTTVTVGTDGVLVSRPGRRRLVRHADIEGAFARGRDLVLRLKSGGELAVRLSFDAADGAVQRIREAAAVPAGAASAGAALDLVAPSFVALRARIQKVLAPAGLSRGAAVSEEDLVELVGDASASDEKRVAAAWALGTGAGAQTRARARVAVEQLAEPRVRVLVNKALDDALEEEDVEGLVGKDHQRA